MPWPIHLTIYLAGAPCSVRLFSQHQGPTVTRSATVQPGACCHRCCSVTQSGPTLFNPMDCSTPGFPVLQYLLELLKLMCIESVMPCNHLILCGPFLLLPSVFPSIRVFSNEPALRIKWSKYWSFRISPSNDYSGLISFRNDWFDLLAVQGTLKSLLQHHQKQQFFDAQPSLWSNPQIHTWLLEKP